MLNDKQLDILTGIADTVCCVEIQGVSGKTNRINDDAVEAVLSLYKLGIIRWIADDLTTLTKQFTVCCNLVNDAFNGYVVVVDYDKLARAIHVSGG